MIGLDLLTHSVKELEKTIFWVSRVCTSCPFYRKFHLFSFPFELFTTGNSKFDPCNLYSQRMLLGLDAEFVALAPAEKVWVPV